MPIFVQALAAAVISASTSMSTPPVFSDLSFDEALAQSKRDGVALLVDTTAVWCAPCKQMDRTTWVDESVTSWIDQNALAIQIDVDDEREWSQSNNIRAMPTLLLYRKGELVDRTTGFMTAEELLEWVDSAGEGLSEVELARQALEKAETSNDIIQAKMNLAQALVFSGDDTDEAATLYAWIWKEIPRTENVSISHTAMRQSYIPVTMTRLASESETARALFAELDPFGEGELPDESASTESVRDWISLNNILNRRDLTFQWIDTEIKAEAGLERLRQHKGIFDLLCQAEKWEQAGLLIDDPARDWAEAVKRHEMYSKDFPERAGTLNDILARDTSFRVSALFAAKRDAEASELVANALDYNDKRMRPVLLLCAEKAGVLNKLEACID